MIDEKAPLVTMAEPAQAIPNGGVITVRPYRACCFLKRTIPMALPWALGGVPLRGEDAISSAHSDAPKRTFPPAHGNAVGKPSPKKFALKGHTAVSPWRRHGFRPEIALCR